MKRALALLLGLVLVFSAASGLARTKKRKKKKKKAKSSVSVPVNVGFGPTWNMVTGPVQSDQRFHYGLKLALYGVIDKELIKRYKHKIPKKYRGMASRMHEVHYRPSVFIPDHLFISPRTDRAAMYGVTWRPLSAGLSPIATRRLTLSINIGLILTYAYLSWEADKTLEEGAPAPTPPFEETVHFLRPGLDAKAELTLRITDQLLLSGGWSSGFYVPQKIKGEEPGIGALGDPRDEDCIWHIGQIFAMLHIRFPYQVRL